MEEGEEEKGIFMSCSDYYYGKHNTQSFAAHVA